MRVLGADMRPHPYTYANSASTARTARTARSVPQLDGAGAPEHLEVRGGITCMRVRDA